MKVTVQLRKDIAGIHYKHVHYPDHFKKSEIGKMMEKEYVDDMIKVFKKYDQQNHKEK